MESRTTEVRIIDIIDIRYETQPKHNKRDEVLEKFRNSGKIILHPGERIVAELTGYPDIVNTDFHVKTGALVLPWLEENDFGEQRYMALISNPHKRGYIDITTDTVIGYATLDDNPPDIAHSDDLY